MKLLTLLIAEEDQMVTNNPLTVDFSGFSPRREFVKPTFGQTLKASIGYTYDPIIESIQSAESVW